MRRETRGGEAWRGDEMRCYLYYYNLRGVLVKIVYTRFSFEWKHLQGRHITHDIIK